MCIRDSRRTLSPNRQCCAIGAGIDGARAESRLFSSAGLPLSAVALYVGCGVTQARRVRITMGMLAFDNSYARLPDRFYARIAPTTVADPQLLRVNRPLAEPVSYTHLTLPPSDLV